MKFTSIGIIIFSAVGTCASEFSLRRRKISENASDKVGIRQNDSPRELVDGIPFRGTGRMVDFEFDDYQDDDNYGRGHKNKSPKNSNGDTSDRSSRSISLGSKPYYAKGDKSYDKHTNSKHDKRHSKEGKNEKESVKDGKPNWKEEKWNSKSSKHKSEKYNKGDKSSKTSKSHKDDKKSSKAKKYDKHDKNDKKSLKADKNPKRDKGIASHKLTKPHGKLPAYSELISLCFPIGVYKLLINV